MKNMLMDAVGGIDLELIEEFIKKDTELKDQSQIIIGRNISRMAVAACAVLIIGAAFSLPKFISPGVNDPSVTPPIIGTDGSDTGSENTNEPTGTENAGTETEDNKGCQSRPSIGMAFECEPEYSLSEEYVEIKLIYGIPSDLVEYGHSAKYGQWKDYYLSVCYSPYEPGQSKYSEAIYIIKHLNIDDPDFEKYIYDETPTYNSNGGTVYLYSEVFKIPISVFLEDNKGYVTFGMVRELERYTISPEINIYSKMGGFYMSYRIEGDKLIMEKTSGNSSGYENIIIKEKEEW